jgi:hypothetical protein
VLPRPKLTGLVTLTALGATLVAATAAQASFHLAKIREVHNGGDAAHSYVMLQMPVSGEGFLMGRYVSFRSADGQIQGDHQIMTNAASQDAQRTFLIGGSAVPGSDSVGADDQLIGTSGAVCYETGANALGGLDCVSWGSFTGSITPLSSPAGTPAPALAPGQSLVRSIAGNCPTALDVSDDTNNSAADFAIGTPIGRNNAATPTEQTCGPIGGSGPPPAASPGTAGKKKKRCKKRKRSSAAPGTGSGTANPPAYAAKKKKCKKKRK